MVTMRMSTEKPRLWGPFFAERDNYCIVIIMVIVIAFVLGVFCWYDHSGTGEELTRGAGFMGIKISLLLSLALFLSMLLSLCSPLLLLSARI